MINRYAGISPKGDLILLELLGEKLKGKSFLHVNSTKEGGGVAEILHRMVPIMTDLGIDARWETIEGDEAFFDITKRIHNALQGNQETITERMWQHHFEVNRKNAETMNLDADMVLIHDPQPAPLIRFKKSGCWVWRCHIDVSNPVRKFITVSSVIAESLTALFFLLPGLQKPWVLMSSLFRLPSIPSAKKTLNYRTTKVHEVPGASSTFLRTGP